MASATRYTRLPRPMNMLARNGTSGTPTMPDAQVNIFSGIGVNPARTSSQKAFQGECAAISRNLGIKVVAEGVETAEQLETMRSLGCDSLQGYYVSRPTDAAGIAATMRAAAEQTLLA